MINGEIFLGVNNNGAADTVSERRPENSEK